MKRIKIDGSMIAVLVVVATGVVVKSSVVAFVVVVAVASSVVVSGSSVEGASVETVVGCVVVSGNSPQSYPAHGHPFQWLLDRTNFKNAQFLLVKILLG